MKLTKQIAAIIVLILSVSVGRSQRPRIATPVWTPPPSRTAKTPFAPKPLPAHNIFKGEAEVWLAEAIETLECGGPYDAIKDKAISDYVSEIGKHLGKYYAAPTKQYTFVVTDDPDPSAMSPGGGRIYISYGMLELLESEDEVAAVLAHEIGHDAFYHAARTVTRQMFWLTETREILTPKDAEYALSELNEWLENPLIAMGDRLLGFDRFDELEADRAAFYNIYKAGYNPHAMTSMLKRLDKHVEQHRPSDAPTKLFLLLFGKHPPLGQRTFALEWESNFVKMPPENSLQRSTAFEETKRRAAALAKGD